MARAQPFTVELYPFVGVDALDEIWNDLVYPLCFSSNAPLVDTCVEQTTDRRRYGHYKLNEPSRKMPIGVFEALLNMFFPRAFVRRLLCSSLRRRRRLLARKSSL